MYTEVADLSLESSSWRIQVPDDTGVSVEYDDDASTWVILGAWFKR